MSSGMEGRRVLVVGASSGVGAELTRAALRSGAQVTMAARREEVLEVIAAEAGGFVAAGDASNPDDAARICESASSRMGGLDLVVYVAGTGRLNEMSAFDPDVWRECYEVNVIGAGLIGAAALPHLDTDGVIAFVSSRTVEDVHWGFGAYGASKAALDHCIRTWRVEHPDRRFVRIVLGNTVPTGFADHIGGGDLLVTAFDIWRGHQAIDLSAMDTADVASMLVESLGTVLTHAGIDASEIKLDARRPGHVVR